MYSLQSCRVILDNPSRGVIIGGGRHRAPPGAGVAVSRKAAVSQECLKTT
jgi:hypothetical protein